MSADLVQAYSLEKDREYIERVQVATVRGGDFALRRDHGLFGSQPWWDAIRDGTVPTHRLDGVIVQLYRRGDWPEFEIEADGERSTWALDGDAKCYAVGKRARVEYVTLEYQKPQPGGELSTPVVLGIWVEP